MVNGYALVYRSGPDAITRVLECGNLNEIDELRWAALFGAGSQTGVWIRP